MIRFICRTLAVLVVAFLTNNAFAGPPFITDDPVPTDYQHWETYLFSLWTATPSNTNLQLPAVQVNYGCYPNVSVEVAFPFVTNFPKKNKGVSGLGDTQLASIVRFLEETDNFPQVAIEPILQLPTGNSRRNLGNGRPWYQLELLLQKTFSKWLIYGSGGYTFNPAPNALNYGFGGVVVQRDFSEKWTAGVELYTQGASNITTGAYTVLNCGAFYHFTERTSLLFSLGHSIGGATNFVGYLGLYWQI